MKKFSFKVILLTIIVIGLSFFQFYLNGNFRVFIENSFVNYFTLSNKIHKEIDLIDEKLRGSTSLSIVIKFKDIEKPKIKTTVSKDDFDDFENDFAKTAKENQYWFTQDKIDTIFTIHNYLETISQIENVQSLSTLLDVGQFLNKNEKLNAVTLAILYKLVLSKYEDLILSPYINIEKNEATITMKLIDSDPIRRNELILKINYDLKEIIKNKGTTYKLSNLMSLQN